MRSAGVGWVRMRVGEDASGRRKVGDDDDGDWGPEPGSEAGGVKEEPILCGVYRIRARGD